MDETGVVPPGGRFVNLWGDGVLTVDREGQFDLVTDADDQPAGSSKFIAITRSPDCASWIDPLSASGDMAGVVDKPWIAADLRKGTKQAVPGAGELYACWSDVATASWTIQASHGMPGEDLMVMASGLIQATDQLFPKAIGCQVAVNQINGNVHFSWGEMSAVGTSWRIMENQCAPQLASCAGARVVRSGFFPKGVPQTTQGCNGQVIQVPGKGNAVRVSWPLPAMAVDSNAGPNGRVYITWSEGNDTTVPPDGLSDDDNVYFSSRPAQSGGAWMPPVAISEDNATREFMPAIAVAPNRTIKVTWYRTRDIEGSPGGGLELWESVSTDKGATWSRRVVSTAPPGGNVPFRVPATGLTTLTDGDTTPAMPGADPITAGRVPPFDITVGSTVGFPLTGRMDIDNEDFTYHRDPDGITLHIDGRFGATQHNVGAVVSPTFATTTLTDGDTTPAMPGADPITMGRMPPFDITVGSTVDFPPSGSMSILNKAGGVFEVFQFNRDPDGVTLHVVDREMLAGTLMPTPPSTGAVQHNVGAPVFVAAAFQGRCSIGDYNGIVADKGSNFHMVWADGRDKQPPNNKPAAMNIYYASEPAAVPSLLKSPQKVNVFLTRQGNKIPPQTCEAGTDVATLTNALSGPIVSQIPKAGGGTQQLGAFEFEMRFDPKMVCVSVVAGALFSGPNAVCSTATAKGIVRFACSTVGKNNGINGPGALAVIKVRPQPELYSQLWPNQDNGIPVQILNQGCNLSDEQGHDIPFSSCEDADITFRFLEGDVTGPDGLVNALDAQNIAMRWGATKGTVLYNSFLDLSPSGQVQGDGRIDIKDLQFVYGRLNSTTANPRPPQDPVNPKK
jgi:hypothetical protein